MATVFLARDLQHDRWVALKVLHPELAHALGPERFLREIRVAARLQHPHILSVHESGEAAGYLWFTMPYAEGESLRQRLSREPQLPLDDAFQIATEVLDALSYAHHEGVIHRDIKPENILLTSGHAMLADFGVARGLDLGGDDKLTETGLAVGTPAYMSPEQAAGDGHLDRRSDIYSMGCVLYEMLAGEPPFTGRTPQAIMARRLTEPVPPLRTLRDIPEPVEQAVTKALARSPADRFAAAKKFLEALTGARRARPQRRWNRQTLALGASVTLALAVVATVLAVGWQRPTVLLDPGRIVVFPVRVSSAREATVAPAAEDVTLALLASLNSTAELVGVDGGRLPGGWQLPEGGSDAARDRIARAHGAAFYISGRLVAADSLHLVLDLHNLRDGPVTHRMLDFPTSTNGWSIGVRAALEMLPVLIPTGGRPDLPSLHGRSPQAMAAYFRGEQAYRSAAFEDALKHFRTAVGADSSFALAALRGAMVASWSERPMEALEMARVAVSREAGLPPRLAHLAHGLEDLMAGRADSAVNRFRQALVLDPENVEAWMGLAETFHHLLPQQPQLDSLAEDAYLRVRQLDPEFAPATFHLIEYAVRRGDVAESGRLLKEFARRRPDSTELGSARLMLDCVRGEMTRSRWQSTVLRNPAQTLAAGQLLAVGGLRQPDCAEAAFNAVLAFDTTTGAQSARNRFGALFGLQSVLVARGRDSAAKALLESDTLFNPGYRGDLYLMNAMAGGDFGGEAEAFARTQLDRFRREPSSLNLIDLWFLGGWEAHSGHAELAAEIGESLQARNAAAGTRRDSLLVASLAARVALARGDSGAALEKLRRLVPTAEDGSALVWNPWESLGGERLLLARLLLARGEVLAALQVASNFDAPASITYLPFLPASLALRLEAADRLGNRKLADHLRQRRTLLAGDFTGATAQGGQPH
jgi:eukaryotic-like serine/threonine-protein kinase